ncbi:MAG TPA: PRC-barrel domain-containing protein [Acidimicrobiales bacterium]|nr:PRC-barrel domain-containing protein [Acidimicrobiales bacterium]
MAAEAPFTIGAEALCTDGVCGRVTQVVIDPVRGRVTHLVVEPEHRGGMGRLVPVEWAQPDGGRIRLSCSRDRLDRLEVAEEVHFLPGVEGHPGYGPEQTLLWPYFGGNTTVPVVVDTVPAGEVAVRRGEQVHATDGRIGVVAGLVVDSRDHQVTHVVLEEGHLFGHKDVAIPIGAVGSVGEDGIRLSLTRQQVDDLPAVDYRR